MDSFAQSYAQARSLFLQAAATYGLEVHSKVHPLKGPEGEVLATDAVCIGDANANKVLYVTSGVHGVEGYYGSGVMVQWLREQISAPAGIKIVLIHACNPYGFAWGRRFTEENVDLNRNFWDLNEPEQPFNQAYADIQHFVEYTDCSSAAFEKGQLTRQRYLQEQGPEQLKIALSGGQQQSPLGLFYVGSQPTWARLTYEALVARYTQGCEHLFFLDLHTGLGPRGYADFLHRFGPDAPQLQTLQQYIGDRVLGNERDEATAQGLDGTTIGCFSRLGKQLGFSVLGGSIECGTTPLPETLEALLQEAALHRFGCADEGLKEQIQKRLRDVFYVDADDWKQQVYEQTCDIRDGALNYLKEL